MARPKIPVVGRFPDNPRLTRRRIAVVSHRPPLAGRRSCRRCCSPSKHGNKGNIPNPPLSSPPSHQTKTIIATNKPFSSPNPKTVTTTHDPTSSPRVVTHSPAQKETLTDENRSKTITITVDVEAAGQKHPVGDHPNTRNPKTPKDNPYHLLPNLPPKSPLKPPITNPPKTAPDGHPQDSPFSTCLPFPFTMTVSTELSTSQTKVMLNLHEHLKTLDTKIQSLGKDCAQV